MKIFLTTLLLLLFSSSLFANDCKLIVPFVPGGSTDLYARAMEKGNRNISVDYKPGAFAAGAISHVEKNKDNFFLYTPGMYSSLNPNKELNIELLQILFPIDLVVITGSNVTFDDLLTKKVNIGINGIGLPHHLVALQLKEKNPLVEIIPTGSDIKALPILINKDIDAYVSSTANASAWMKNFSTITKIIEVPFNTPVKKNNVTLSNLNFMGVYINKDADTKQREHIQRCVTEATLSKEYQQDMRSLGVEPVNIIGEEKNRLLINHINLLRKHAL